MKPRQLVPASRRPSCFARYKRGLRRTLGRGQRVDRRFAVHRRGNWGASRTRSGQRIRRGPYHATLASRGRFVIMADSDMSYDFSCLGPFRRSTPIGMRSRNGEPISRWHRPRRDAVEEPLHREPSSLGDRQAVLPLLRPRLPLRDSWLSSGRLQSDGPSHYRHGVRIRDAHQGHTSGHARRGGAHDTSEGWTVSAASPSSLARWVAPPAFHAALQPELACSSTQDSR